MKEMKRIIALLFNYLHKYSQKIDDKTPKEFRKYKSLT